MQLHLNVYTRKLMALKKLNCSIFDRFFPQKLRSQMYNIDFNRKENMYEAKLQWRLRTNVLYLMLNLWISKVSMLDFLTVPKNFSRKLSSQIWNFEFHGENSLWKTPWIVAVEIIFSKKNLSSDNHIYDFLTVFETFWLFSKINLPNQKNSKRTHRHSIWL